MAILQQAAFTFEVRSKYDQEHSPEFTHLLTVHGVPKLAYPDSLTSRNFIKRRAKRDSKWYVGALYLDAHDEEPDLLRDSDEDTLADVWVYRHLVYLTEDRELSPDDVRALINLDRNKRRLALEKAHALQAMTDQLDRPRRQSIPQAVRVAVWQRDSGRCVECESKDKLEFDHIIPIAMGGANTERNLQLLCETCNRRKGATLG